MIYLVHGEDLSYSRKIIINQLKKMGLSKKTEFGILDTSPSDLLDSLTSADLFGEPPFVVLDISAASRTNLEPYVKILEKVPTESTLIILSSKDLPKTHTFLQNAPRLNIKIVRNEKKPTSNIFSFIDDVYTGNRTAAYRELNKLIQEDADPFYLFSMLLYGLRKYKNRFRGEKLNSLFREIYQIEKGAKTGNISPDMLIPYTIEKILYAQLQATQI